MRVFLCGQKSFGRESLKAVLDAGHKVVGVAVAPPEKYYDKMHGLAIKLGIGKIIFSDKLVSSDIPDGTDLIVAAHSHHFISMKTIERAKYGAIGFHPSLLPRHRGRDAVRWTVAFGDPITGGTIYRLDSRVDGGDILSQRFLHVDKSWDYHELWKNIFPVGVEMIVDAIRQVENGTAPAVPQDERFATWEPSFTSSRLFRPELLQLCHG